MVERSPCHILVSLATLGHQVEDVSFFDLFLVLVLVLALAVVLVLVLVLQPYVNRYRQSFHAMVVEARNLGQLPCPRITFIAL